MTLALHLLYPALCISLGLLVVGYWTENVVLTRMSRDGWMGRTGWRRFFMPTREIMAAHQAIGTRPAWIRAYRAANVAIFVGMAGVIIWTVMLCILITRMH